MLSERIAWVQCCSSVALTLGSEGLAGHHCNRACKSGQRPSLGVAATALRGSWSHARIPSSILWLCSSIWLSIDPMNCIYRPLTLYLLAIVPNRLCTTYSHRVSTIHWPYYIYLPSTDPVESIYYPLTQLSLFPIHWPYSSLYHNYFKYIHRLCILYLNIHSLNASIFYPPIHSSVSLVQFPKSPSAPLYH